jgi:hypothetical protein
VLGISGSDPSFRRDDGSADRAVADALEAFAAGQASEREALTALARSRLLVPVVAVLSEQRDTPERAHQTADGAVAGRGEKASEMAMPTLIGLDGRRAIPAFTCLDSMRRWRPAARPVPAAARQVWRAATGDSCAVVIDVAGPVRLAVEGARLAALACDEPVPAPWADPDVREVVSDVLAGELAVTRFDLRPGEPDHDLVIALTFGRQGAECDVTRLASEMANAVMTRLGARLRRGVAVWLGSGT